MIPVSHGMMIVAVIAVVGRRRVVMVAVGVLLVNVVVVMMRSVSGVPTVGAVATDVGRRDPGLLLAFAAGVVHRAGVAAAAG